MFSFGGSGLFLITADSAAPADKDHRILIKNTGWPREYFYGTLKRPSKLHKPGRPLSSISLAPIAACQVLNAQSSNTTIIF